MSSSQICTNWGGFCLLLRFLVLRFVMALWPIRCLQAIGHGLDLVAHALLRSSADAAVRYVARAAAADSERPGGGHVAGGRHYDPGSARIAGAVSGYQQRGSASFFASSKKSCPSVM